MKESDILFESEHFYCVQIGKQVEIRMHKGTHSLAVGRKNTLEGAKALILKCEKYPKNIHLLAGK